MLEMTLAEFWEIMIISHNEDFSLGYELKVIFNQYIFNNIKKLKNFIATNDVKILCLPTLFWRIYFVA